MLLFLPVAVVWLLIRRHTRLAVTVIVAATFVVVPWTLRNARVYHRLVTGRVGGWRDVLDRQPPAGAGEGDWRQTRTSSR